MLHIHENWPRLRTLVCTEKEVQNVAHFNDSRRVNLIFEDMTSVIDVLI